MHVGRASDQQTDYCIEKENIMGIPKNSGPNGAAPADAPQDGGSGGKAKGGGEAEGISQEEYDKLSDKEKAKLIEDPNNPGQYIPNPDV
jgi:hypothetical protein